MIKNSQVSPQSTVSLGHAAWKDVSLLGAVLLSLALTAPTATAANLDLNGWIGFGGGAWTITHGGTSATQTVNGDPTGFVSADNYLNTEFNGKFVVQTTDDDDFIGFVFGYNSPLAGDGNNDFDFLLFDWKQAAQVASGYAADRGFNLSRVQGTITDYDPGFWGHTDDPGTFDVLDTLYSGEGGYGWADNVEYDFTLRYEADRITIDINNQPVFDVTGSFPAGRFGFYSYSQQDVRFHSFTATQILPASAIVPEPGTLALLALAAPALLLVGRKRGAERRGRRQ